MDVWTQWTSPLGDLWLTAHDNKLTRVTMTRPDVLDNNDWAQDDAAFTGAKDQLAAYFAGKLQEFDLDVQPVGTQFQQKVWAALRTIDYGEVRSYQEIAEQIGQPTASRAVGLATGRNPLGIVIPCHRVVGASGQLTGYAWGLDRKKALLSLEATSAQPSTH